MSERGISYYEIWKVIEKFFPLYIRNNVMEGYDDRSILSRANPFAYINLHHFLRPILNDLERKVYCYENLEFKLEAMINELEKCNNWRTDSLVKYFHSSLLIKTRIEIKFIQKYVTNMHIEHSNDVFCTHDFQTYRYIGTPPIDYCDLNMYFLAYFPELLLEYRELVLKYYGDDTDSDFVYSTLLKSYLSKNMNDKTIHSKILKFFQEAIQLPDMDVGISPIGVIMGNGTGVISRLNNQIMNFDLSK